MTEIHCPECGGDVEPEPGGYVDCVDCEYNGRLWEDVDAVELHTVELERRPKPVVASVARSKLSPETGVSLAEWTLRMGLGPAFARDGGDAITRDVDPGPEDLGALFSVSFKPLEDPAQAQLFDDLRRTHADARESLVPENCPSCGCPVYECSARVVAGQLEPQTPIECGRCGFEPEIDAPVDVDAEDFSSAWGSGAVGDDVDDPPPARGATRCPHCDEWTDEHDRECQRCGRDRFDGGDA